MWLAAAIDSVSIINASTKTGELYLKKFYLLVSLSNHLLISKQHTSTYARILQQHCANNFKLAVAAVYACTAASCSQMHIHRRRIARYSRQSLEQRDGHSELPMQTFTALVTPRIVNYA
jgi:hypothetical protein